MSKIDNRFIKYAAVGGGALAKADTLDEAVLRLQATLGYEPKNYDVYYVIGKENEELRLGIIEGMMLWSPGAQRGRVRKVRAGNICHFEGMYDEQN